MVFTVAAVLALFTSAVLASPAPLLQAALETAAAQPSGCGYNCGMRPAQTYPLYPQPQPVVYPIPSPYVPRPYCTGTVYINCRQISNAYTYPQYSYQMPLYQQSYPSAAAASSTVDFMLRNQQQSSDSSS